MFRRRKLKISGQELIEAMDAFSTQLDEMREKLDADKAVKEAAQILGEAEMSHRLDILTAKMNALAIYLGGPWKDFAPLNDYTLQNAMYTRESRELYDDGGAVTTELPNAQGEYGRHPNNPIPVNGPTGEAVWLSRLVYEPTASRMAFHRLSSLEGSQTTDDPLDIFELVSLDGKFYDILFLDMYHQKPSTKAPSGYSLSDEINGITGTSADSLGDAFPAEVYNAAAEYAHHVFGSPLVASRDLGELSDEAVACVQQGRKDAGLDD